MAINDHHGAIDGLQVNEAGQDVEQAVALPDLLPQAGRLVAVRILWAARAEAVAVVERQEMRALSGKPGGRVNQVGIDGEIHRRPPRNDEKQRGIFGFTTQFISRSVLTNAL